MGYAKPTAARLIDQRARRRATQTLVEIHRDEYQQLYDLHRAEAEQEAEHLAAAPEAMEHYRDEPVRLKTGRRNPGEKAGDRIDVARCSHCIKHHDKGHRCSNCGAAPTAPVSPDAVRALAAEGVSVQEIAHRFNLTTITVRRVLVGREASA